MVKESACSDHPSNNRTVHYRQHSADRCSDPICLFPVSTAVIYRGCVTSAAIAIASHSMNFRRPLPTPLEPGYQQESVWQYPRPPALENCELEVKVFLQGVLVAETNSALRVLETSHPPTFYLPPEDVDMSFFTQTASSSFCEWKGSATYWDVAVGDQVVRRGSWSYQSPNESFVALQRHFSFYPSLFDCFVSGSAVQPQPGEFYGGWVTEDVVGPFKGEPGSEFW